MTADDTLIDLLVQAEEWQQQGRPFTVQELCPDRPEMWPTLHELLAGLGQVDQALHLKASHPTITYFPGADSSPSLAAPPSTLRAYEILGEIGRGGMGVVYRARQVGLNRLVALKMILAGGHAGEDARARFRREAEAAARLSHPNIVQVHEVGEQDGVPFLCLEYVDGPSLAEWSGGRPQPPRQAAELVRTLARAVHVAHQAGIVHRDLTPRNILLTTEGVPKVTDFGLAKHFGGSEANTSAQQTQSGAILGTASYMAPEQATGKSKDVGPPSDIYALGAVLYELLTGRPPFLGETSLDTLAQVVSTEPVSLRRLQPKVPRDLDTICLKCLAKEPRKRYASALELADDLGRFLDGRPIVARPAGIGERLWRWCRRNPRVAGLTAAVFLLLLLTAVVAGVGYVREANQRTEAERQRGIARDEAAKNSRLFYLANMNLAQQAWESGNISRLRQLLAETQDHPDRHFEWAYWRRMCQFDRLILQGHTGAVHFVCFSPDGKHVLTGSADHTARIWDAGTGQEVHCLRGHTAAVTAVAYSTDGLRIATASADGTARLWDRTGQALRTFEGHSRGVASVVFSPNGDRLVTGSEDRTARIWDAATGRLLLTLQGHADGVTSVAVSGDGGRILTGSRDGMPKVWDAVTGKEILTLKERHWDAVTCVTFSADSQVILTGGWDYRGKFWNATTGNLTGFLTGHTWQVNTIAVSRDGRRVVTGSHDRTAKVWDFGGGNEVFTLRGHTGPVLSAAFSADSHRLVTGSGDGTARIWDAATGHPPVPLASNQAELAPGAGTPGGRRVVAGGRDPIAKVLDAATGRELCTLKGHTGDVWTVILSPDESRVVTASKDRTAKVWDTETGQEILTLAGHTDEIVVVAFSGDGRRLLTGSADWTARIWDAASGRMDLVLKGHTNGITSVAFSPDGRQVVTASWDQTVKVWDAATGQPTFNLTGHKKAVQAVAFTPDSRRILTGSGDNTAKLWDAATGRETLTLKGHPFRSVAFSPDGWRIIAGERGEPPWVWEAASPAQIASWMAEERAAEESAAAAVRERADHARAEGFLQDWLILAPIPMAAGQSGADAVDQEQVPDEVQLQPRAGDKVVVDGREFAWKEHQQQDYFLDFNALLQQRMENHVGYAVCYLKSDVERKGLVLKVGSDDQAKVYLNGVEVYRHRRSRHLMRDRDSVANLTLKAGVNVLVFKVVNEAVDWKGCLRFTDKEGNPVRGLRVQLKPES